MNYKQLKYFQVLARTEHMTKSAELLFITQPTLSRAVSELEKELNIPLFEKQGRNIKLTKYGEIFLKYVDQSLSELYIGINTINNITSTEKGNIDLAFIYTAGTEFMPQLIKDFKEYKKNITFSFKQSNTKNIISGLKKGMHDIAFCSKIDDEEDIEFIKIVKQDIVLITPKGHPLSTYKKLSIKDIKPYPFLTFNNQSGLRPFINYLFAKANIKPNIICEFEEEHTLISFVCCNFGVAIVPKIKALNLYDIEVVDIDDYGFSRYIYLAYVKNRYISPTNKIFIDYVKSYSKFK